MKALLFFFLVLFLVSCAPPLPQEGPSPYGDYSSADVQYFLEIGLCFELSRCDMPRVRKWTGDIFIQLHGHYSPQEDRELDNIIAELSQLTGLSITKSPGSANINIYFVPQNQFKLHCSTYNPSNSQDGYFELAHSSDIINTANICIETGLDVHTTHHLLREELTQSLGIGNDSHKYIDSIFQKNPHYRPLQYAEIDKNIIRLLYDQRIKVGMTGEEVELTLRTNVANTQVASVLSSSHFAGEGF